MKRAIYSALEARHLKWPLAFFGKMVSRGFMYFLILPIFDCLTAMVVYSLLRYQELLVIDGFSIHLPFTVIMMPIISAALHEFGHVAMAVRLRGTGIVSGLLLYPLEHKFAVRFNNEDVSDEEVLQIYLGGPVFPFGMGLILLVIVLLMHPSSKMFYLYPASMLLGNLIHLIPNMDKDRTDGMVIKTTRTQLGLTRGQVLWLSWKIWWRIARTFISLRFKGGRAQNELAAKNA